METTSNHIEYKLTGKFSKLIVDYLSGNPALDEFCSHRPDINGIKQAIEDRKNFATNRIKIRDTFSESYVASAPSAIQIKNIEALARPNTFTICTAHQPNIFTGYLYFIYKTAHTIVLANYLNEQLPDNYFVPVFYIGSEDNDLDELSKFKLNGKSYIWNTDQKGAVGRMLVDEGIIKLINQIESDLAHLPFSSELIKKIKEAYSIGSDIAHATFKLLNEFFREDGLLVLQPDQQILKGQMKRVFKDDLIDSIPEALVSVTNEKIEKKYHLQVSPRKVNLFYLRDGIRNRIDRKGNSFLVDATDIKFTSKEILDELDNFPERFSPNVILRGLYQETILPNIVFIGGGSEVAYWMQLKNLFNHYAVPFPVLVLRNSFMIMNGKQEHKLNELKISLPDLFKDETVLSNEMIVKWAGTDFSLSQEMAQAKSLFNLLKTKSGDIDKSLVQHVHSLEVDMLKKIDTLEKKMLKAERKKQAVQLQRIWKLKAELFPNGNLQERVENFMPYYAEYGPSFIRAIIEHSLSLEHEFISVVLH